MQKSVKQIDVIRMFPFSLNTLSQFTILPRCCIISFPANPNAG